MSTAARRTPPAPRSRATWRRWRRGSAGSRSPPAWPPRTRWCASTCRPGDHVVLPNDAYGGTFRLFDKVEQAWGVEHTPAPVDDVEAVAAAIRPGRPSWCGSRRPPTRCSTSATSRRSPPWPTTPARCSSSTTPSPRPTCSSRSASAPTSSCTPPPSTPVATPTSSAGRSWCATSTSPSRSPSTRTRSAPWPGRSTPGWCCAASRPSASGWTATATTPSASWSS